MDGIKSIRIQLRDRPDNTLWFNAAMPTWRAAHGVEQNTGKCL